MLLPRISRLLLRKETPRNTCASCLSRQHAAYTTQAPMPIEAPNARSAMSPSKVRPPRLDLSDRPPKRKRRLRPTPPQPGPPSPPFHEAPAVRPKYFTTEKALVKDAIMCAKMSQPRKFFPEDVARVGSGPVMSVGVPRAPNYAKDYTSMGPDIVASWRPGASLWRLAGSDIRVANRANSSASVGASASTKGAGKNYGLSIRYSYGHALHPWHAKYLVASPGFDEVVSDGSPGRPIGFPHSAAEVFRRRYAIKNRTEPLWWFVTVFSDDSDLPYSNLVRHKLRFKLQSAFRTALKQRGYSPIGVRLEGEAGTPARFQQLYGSARVDGVTRLVLDASYDELVAYLAQVVVALESRLGGRKQGQALHKKKRPGRPGRASQTDPAPEDDWTADQEGFEMVGSGARQSGGQEKAKSALQPKPRKGAGKTSKPRARAGDDEFVVLRGSEP